MGARWSALRPRGQSPKLWSVSDLQAAGRGLSPAPIHRLPLRGGAEVRTFAGGARLGVRPAAATNRRFIPRLGRSLAPKVRSSAQRPASWPERKRAASYRSPGRRPSVPRNPQLRAGAMNHGQRTNDKGQRTNDKVTRRHECLSKLEK